MGILKRIREPEAEALRLAEKLECRLVAAKSRLTALQNELAGNRRKRNEHLVQGDEGSDSALDALSDRAHKLQSDIGDVKEDIEHLQRELNEARLRVSEFARQKHRNAKAAQLLAEAELIEKAAAEFELALKTLSKALRAQDRKSVV